MSQQEVTLIVMATMVMTTCMGQWTRTPYLFVQQNERGAMGTVNQYTQPSFDFFANIQTVAEPVGNTFGLNPGFRRRPQERRVRQQTNGRPDGSSYNIQSYPQYATDQSVQDVETIDNYQQYDWPQTGQQRDISLRYDVYNTAQMAHPIRVSRQFDTTVTGRRPDSGRIGGRLQTAVTARRFNTNNNDAQSSGPPREGYVGARGGENGFPINGGYCSGELCADGGLAAGVANGIGAENAQAFAERRRTGRNQDLAMYEMALGSVSGRN